jgi:hypothetical protein
MKEIERDRRRALQPVARARILGFKPEEAK